MNQSRRSWMIISLIGVIVLGFGYLYWSIALNKGEPLQQAIIHEDFVETTTTTEVVETTTTQPKVTTTVMEESEGDMVTTTTIPLPEWVDLPESNRMQIPSIDIDVEAFVTGPERVNDQGKKNDPAYGTVDFWVSTHPYSSVESIFVDACELGITFVTGHTLRNGGVGYNFVDDESTSRDTGIPLGAEVIFSGGTEDHPINCTYEVIEWPEWVIDEETDVMSPLGDTHAAFYPKEATREVGEVYIALNNQLVMQPDGYQGLLVLSTSYGGPCGCEYKSNGKNKYYNGVVLAKLVDVQYSPPSDVETGAS